MGAISKLFSQVIVPEIQDRRQAKETILVSADDPLLNRNRKKRTGRYEQEVFKYLLKAKHDLGIKSLLKYEALRVDGGMILGDDRRLVVEAKLCMSWAQASKAEWEFRQFLSTPYAKEHPVHGGVVFFEEFSGDWNRRVGRRWLENGWNAWYGGHAKVEGLPLHLVRMRQGRHETYSEALLFAQLGSLDKDQLESLLASVNSLLAPETP